MGWAKANMLYDLASKPPEAGSLQESLFALLSRKRMEQEHQKVRLLVEAVLTPHIEKSNLSETFEDYTNSMFPYFSKGQKAEEMLAKEALEKWTKNRVFKVSPMWNFAEKPKRLQASLERGKRKREEIDSLRRAGRVRKVR